MRTWTPEAFGDIIFNGNASWFGGPNDKDDNGETASGVDNSVLGVLGCALPMRHSNGRQVASCQNSPLPDMPWKTGVEITFPGGLVITVPLIDVGPADDEDRPIDLTPSLYDKSGRNHADPNDSGIIPVTLRVIGAAKYLLSPYVYQPS